MSKTKFDNILRSALWTTYNSICFYCNRPLNWDDLHIDHIIPESLGENPARWKEIRRAYELEQDFDLNGLYNLVPCHSKCNLKKTSELFVKATTLFYLGLTRSKKEKIEYEMEKLRKRKNKGMLLSKLQSALSTDLITLEELKELLWAAQQSNWNVACIKIPSGVEFIDEVYDAFYLHQDYTALYDKKLLVGGVFDYLDLSSDNDETITVSTLREWQDALQKGYYPLNNASMKMSSSFSFLEELLEALKRAKMPRVSFISEPWLELDQLNYLSPDLLHDFEGRLCEYSEKGFSVGDLVKKGIIKVNQSDYYKVSLEYSGMETSLVEQFRADFNNDGLEDIFVRGWTRAVGGTLGFGFTTYLTRYSGRHLLEEIKI